VDYPFIDNGKVLVRVVYGDPTLPADIPIVDDQALVHEGVGAFLKVFDDIKRRDNAATTSAQKLPDLVLIDEDEFKKRVAEQEVARQRISRMRKLFAGDNEEKRL